MEPDSVSKSPQKSIKNYIKIGSESYESVALGNIQSKLVIAKTTSSSTSDSSRKVREALL